jgi:hypothetical protein
MDRLKISIFCAAVTLVGLAGCSKNAGGADAKRREPLMASLKDSESARFRNERIAKSGALCGEVNSKNSFGGYVGFKRFILAGQGASYLEDVGALGAWSPTDEQLRDQEETSVKLHVLKYNDEHRGIPLDMPSDTERREYANRRFFEAKWAKLCGDAKA